jgi:hypothetical protein
MSECAHDVLAGRRVSVENIVVLINLSIWIYDKRWVRKLVWFGYWVDWSDGGMGHGKRKVIDCRHSYLFLFHYRVGSVREWRTHNEGSFACNRKQWGIYTGPRFNKLSSERAATVGNFTSLTKLHRPAHRRDSNPRTGPQQKSNFSLRHVYWVSRLA